MGVGDDAALGSLAEDLREPDDGEPPAVQTVTKHVAAANRRELIRVAHKQQPGPARDSVQQGVHQRNVHHAHLIYDDQIEDERIVPVADEALLGVVFEEPVDGLGIGARSLCHALGGPARGCGQSECQAHAGEGMGDAADDGGLACARAAGNDHDAGV